MIDINYVRKRVKESDLIDLSRDRDELAAINEDRIEALIQDATSEFENAAYQGGYSVPIASPDDFIKRVVFDLFLYLLYARKYDDEEMKDVYVRYNKAHSKLKQIASGEIKLSGVATRQAFTRCIITNKITTDRIFTDDVLKS